MVALTDVEGNLNAVLEGVSPTITYYLGTSTNGVSLNSTPPTAVGTYTVAASFPGSTDYTSGQSTPLTFYIAQGTLTSVSVSAPTVPFGQSVTLTATVTTDPPSTTTPAGGSVTFVDGDTTLGTAPLTGGIATFPVPQFTAGVHAVTAIYSGAVELCPQQRDPRSQRGHQDGGGRRTSGYKGDAGLATTAEFENSWG